MKVLLVADLHYALKQFDWLMAEVEHYDILVIAGDLLDVSAIATLDAQVVVVQTYLERLAESIDLVVCSGNHDLNDEIRGEKVATWFNLLDQYGICRDGQSKHADGIVISALPWWDGERTKADIVHQLRRDQALVGESEKWIWVHHAPPAKSGLSWGGSRYFGDNDLIDWMLEFKPSFVLSGHVHEAPFLVDGAWVDKVGKTWCFNMGRQIGQVPCHIALNLDLGEALWLSQKGPERIVLSGENRPEQLAALPDWL